MTDSKKEETSEEIARRKQTEIVRQGLKKACHDLDDKLLDKKANELIFAPQDRKIVINGQTISASDLRMKVAQTIEETGSSSGIEKAQDLQMMVAQSIESINSETSSSQEYFRWLDDASNIIKHMNDGFVTHADLNERNDFLNMSHQRETEMLVCLSLYAGSSNPKAVEQSRVLRYKLVKLREMRSAIETSTKNKADVPVSEEEFRRAVPYYKACKGLTELPFGYDMTFLQKRKLGIDHDNDADLNDSRALQDQLINRMLDRLLKEDRDDFANIAFVGLEDGKNDTAMLNWILGKGGDEASAEKNANSSEVSDTSNETLSKSVHAKMKNLDRRKGSFGVDYTRLEALKQHQRA